MYDKKNKLALFENQFKKNENHPAYTGPGDMTRDSLRQIVAFAKANPNEDPIVLDCAAWNNTSKAGKEYISVTFGVQDPQYAKDGNAGSSDDPIDDDDIPF